MQCPKCQFENPDDVNFCVECGRKLEKICPECGYGNSLSHKFCGGCGHKLSLPVEALPKDLSFDEKLTKIQKYLPKGLIEKILNQRDKIEGERKQVTVMFCDMEGFTSLSEKLGSEEAYAIMDQVYEILIHKVHNYEGTVNEMTGDGIMALFGAPIALEDAPQRAIRSAMAIHREMTKFSDKLKQENESIPQLKMRIGIHTGPVVVGTLGNDLRVEFKAVGDTVNLTSRMENLAEPGTTYVTEKTFKLTEGFFRFEALGEKKIKGKEEPVNTYRVISSSTRRTRFDVSAERGLTHFVGRERELELLLDGFERSKKGLGQAFSIVSEAGVGKSRLLYEFRKGVANEDITFLEGKCLSYSKGTAYHPIIDILKATFDVQERDGDFEIIEKIKKGLKILGTDEGSTLPFLLELLSVKDSGFDKINMSPESKKDRTMEALKRITLKGAEARTLVIAFEDLHWSDNSSEEYLKILLDSISGATIFLIFTFRPEFVHTWGGRSYHSQVNLNRLSNRESLFMVYHLLGTDNIDRDLEELILEKSEGVPLFIEEFVKSLKDLKIIEIKNGKYHLAKEIQKISIPSTIQDVIMARVDTLPEGVKKVFQVGSAIEREFNYELLKKVTGLPENELLSALSALKDSELLFERGIFPGSTYVFKHALTREVVYDSILVRRKKRLHDDIGNAIEELYADNIDAYYEILAEHYIASENYIKAAEYSRLAGRKAARAVSFTDAIFFGERWVRCLEKLPQAEEVEKKIIDARTTLAFYNIQMEYFGESKSPIDPIVELALKHNYKRRLAQIYTSMGIHSHLIEEDYLKAVEYLKKAIKMAQETNNFISLIFANHHLGHVFADNCEFHKGFYHIEKALEIVEMGNVLWSIAVHKACIAFNIYHAQGKIDLAYQTSNEALVLAEESGDILSKTEANTNHGVCCLAKGFLEEAEKHLLVGKGFSERAKLPGSRFVSNFYLGEVYFCRGEYRRAQEFYNNAISFEKIGIFGPSRFNLIRLAESLRKVMNHEKDVDLKLLDYYVSQNKLKRYDSLFRRYFGEILLNTDDEHLLEAENWIKQAIEANERYGMMFHLGQDFALYAELIRRKGDQSKAREKLDRAIEILKECGADGWVEKYEKELTKL
ncbi:MAG: AAA family ATPase [Desulfobacterales bacterium]|nr:MAG: AAA family ATPase [Desulfobacterales bacterium]